MPTEAVPTEAVADHGLRLLRSHDAVFDPDPVDRPLTDDVTAAAALLDQFTDL
ncbi:hypothetical protein J7E96_33195 [Streptomyces sp. ISL-96]|uniref:hypothetical protein n=1 Tax=Streptomyces sp. ISL-96 TaxID=2819191 RepID=UPI001C149FD5|nr:hypothetical protein [Streptomyces sp. ISL-96]MBT2493272.1 hypothetical protein [Streptomyces sp. ISL-96]